MKAGPARATGAGDGRVGAGGASPLCDERQQCFYTAAYAAFHRFCLVLSFVDITEIAAVRSLSPEHQVDRFLYPWIVSVSQSDKGADIISIETGKTTQKISVVLLKRQVPVRCFVHLRVFSGHTQFGQIGQAEMSGVKVRILNTIADKYSFRSIFP